MVRSDFLVLLSQQLLLSVESVFFFFFQPRCLHSLHQSALALPTWEGMPLLCETCNFKICSFVISKSDPNLVLPKPVGSL